MLSRYLRRAFWIFIFVCASTLIAAEPELLKENDIHNIMTQIFDQHVDKKEISKDILKHSYKIYLDQFDPDRIYLMQSEVDPFLNPTNSELAADIAQYKQGNYSAYDKLNGLAQKAIARARDSRKEIEKQSPALFIAAKTMPRSFGQEYLDPDVQIHFAKSDLELKERIKKRIEQFINAEMQYFGQSAVMNRQPQMIEFYDKQAQHFENQYLFKNELGQLLPPKEHENLMSLHILKALASSLDAHTTFFDAAEAYDMRIHLEKELHGIGVVLQQGLEGVVITQVMPGGPAAKNGILKVNDQITEINGKTIAGEPFDDVMELLHGKDGSSVTLKVKRSVANAPSRPAEILIVVLKREPIVMDNDRVDMSYDKFGNGIIGKLTLHSFYQSENGISSEKDLRDAIHKLKKAGNLRGLILDLRDNSGGYLSQAIKVAGLFISNGIVVISKYSNGEEQYYRDMEGKEEFNGPLVILTSRATASAAEIVAEALQDYGVAIVVGDTQTYGKGTIQSQTVTDNQSTSYFKVTVGKYYTVSGKTPQIRGVQADIVVPTQFSHEHLGEEYLEYPLTNDTIPSAYNDPLTDVPVQYKPWFLKYYIPTLQHQTDVWQKMLPVLKKNSEYRILHNKNFQAFLKKIDGKQTPEEEEQEAAFLNPMGGTQKNFGSEDLQMNEAVNIVKDMIVLHSQGNNHSIGTDTKVSAPTALQVAK